MDVKFFIGPMSKNIVDSIIEFQSESKNKIGLIPSRRQVDFNGGYANKWTTKGLSNYAKDLLIMRDHSGPGQGQTQDDGYESLKHDCNHFDYIHIDPWKKFPSFSEGSRWTLDMIQFCFSISPNVKFEIGTEEAIRRFEPEELQSLLNYLKANLPQEAFSQIKYLVIQSGTSLSSNQNTGNFDLKGLKKMVAVAKQNNLKSKEHNGDYISEELIKLKMDSGLDSINIAPEFGLIETDTYLNKMKKRRDLFDKFWQISYNSKKWVKWVSKDFDPIHQKESLIRVCGHYVFSDSEFLKDIKSELSGIDQLIKINIKKKLTSLHRTINP